MAKVGFFCRSSPSTKSKGDRPARPQGRDGEGGGSESLARRPDCGLQRQDSRAGPGHGGCFGTVGSFRRSERTRSRNGGRHHRRDRAGSRPHRRYPQHQTLPALRNRCVVAGRRCRKRVSERRPRESNAKGDLTPVMAPRRKCRDHRYWPWPARHCARRQARSFSARSAKFLILIE